MLMILYIVTTINVLIGAGFSIAGIVRPQLVAAGEPTAASRVFALYAAARAIPLALIAIAAMIGGPLIAVIWIGALAGVIQLVDGYIGRVQKDAGKTYGPLAIGVLQFVAIGLVTLYPV
jgi:hypothetical protein